MRYFALATDFDNTLTTTGRVEPRTLAALDRLRKSGRRTLLVTGRLLGDLLATCSCVDGFNYIIAENGALLYDPATRDSTLLAEPLPGKLVEALRRRNIEPLEFGEAIVATHVPHQTTVLEVIRETGLERQVIFNRGAVMVLPPGVNKATGLQKALREMGLSPHEVVAVGDAENDHSFLQAAECPVAVGNAVESLKNTAAFVTQGEAADGVVELIDHLIATDLAEFDSQLAHRHISLGKRLDGTMVRIPPYGHNILIAGPSGSGKSRLTCGFIERLMRDFYQVCIIDPEGDYVGLPSLVTLGDETRVPSCEEIAAVLRDPGINLNINLLGVRLAERPAYFNRLFSHLQGMRARTSRPHWIVIDEAHHMIPGIWGAVPLDSPTKLSETILVTVHPDHLSPSVLPMIDAVVAVGADPEKTFHQFTSAARRAPLAPLPFEAHENRVACWFTREPAPFPMDVIHGRSERIRHHRKYALGELDYRSFYFTGPQKRLNLKAQNLAMFCQIAEGVDEDTWSFHLKNGDYANWFKTVIKDDKIADLASDLAGRHDLSPALSRALLCDAIGSRYTLPE